MNPRWRLRAASSCLSYAREGKGRVSLPNEGAPRGEGGEKERSGLFVEIGDPQFRRDQTITGNVPRSLSGFFTISRRTKFNDPTGENCASDTVWRRGPGGRGGLRWSRAAGRKTIVGDTLEVTPQALWFGPSPASHQYPWQPLPVSDIPSILLIGGSSDLIAERTERHD
jgi:hypothetical protein